MNILEHAGLALKEDGFHATNLPVLPLGLKIEDTSTGGCEGMCLRPHDDPHDARHGKEEERGYGHCN